jgi:hypothetical protein
MKYFFVSYAFNGGFGRCAVKTDDSCLQIGNLECALVKQHGDKLSILYYREISEEEARYFDRPGSETYNFD